MPEPSDNNGDEPNLELPSLNLSLRRKKKSAKKATDTDSTTALEDGAATDAADVSAPAEPSASVAPTGAAKATKPPSAPPVGTPPGPPPSAPPAEATQPQVTSAAAESASSSPSAPAALPTPARPPAKKPRPAVASVVAPAAAPATADAAPGSTSTRIVTQQPGTETSEAPPRLRKVREPRELRLPPVDSRIAAVVSGAIAGLVATLLTYVVGQGCRTIFGVGGCSGGVNFVALSVILAVSVIIGGAFLKAWQISDPVSTSFLGIGLVAVIAMLFFLPSIDSIWMFLVIPLMTALMFLLSWWVTQTFVEAPEDSS